MVDNIAIQMINKAKFIVLDDFLKKVYYTVIFRIHLF